MILTCPKCESKFMLSAQALAPDGKRVKCSSCGETWFEEPDPDELYDALEKEASGEVPPLQDPPETIEENILPDIGFSEDEDNEDEAQNQEEDIPDAVKPRNEEGNVPALSDGETKGSSKKAQSIIVFLLSAFLMFLILIAPLIIFKTSIIKAWPDSIAFYKTLGMEGGTPGQGVVFDQMRGDVVDDHFVLNGQIINLTSSDKTLPFIEVSLKDANMNVIEHYYVRMPKSTLDAEETLPIQARFPVEDMNMIEGASIQFVLKPKNKTFSDSILQKKEENEEEQVSEGEVEDNSDMENETNAPEGLTWTVILPRSLSQEL